ncbi:MAG: hypothetical protein JKY52_04390 [Flavobacteriales bacterium]|nr:hypothetical protein [Flavobacteriales bacterium]
MKLWTSCINCAEKIHFSEWVNDRVELSMSKGRELKLTCKACNTQGAYNVDDIYAKGSKLTQILALTILVIGTPVTFYFLWDYFFLTAYVYIIAGISGMLVVPATVYLTIIKNEEARIRRFNSHRTKGYNA